MVAHSSLPLQNLRKQIGFAIAILYSATRHSIVLFIATSFGGRVRLGRAFSAHRSVPFCQMYMIFLCTDTGINRLNAGPVKMQWIVYKIWVFFALIRASIFLMLLQLKCTGVYRYWNMIFLWTDTIRALINRLNADPVKMHWSL